MKMHITTSSILKQVKIIFLLSALLLPSCVIGPGEELEVGDHAPNFTLPNALGGTVTLSDYRFGQPVLLYFHMAVG